MTANQLQGPAGGRAYDLATDEHNYANWQGKPAQTILFCTHPRSGSTLLGEAIYFSGELGCPLEYFHRGFRPSLEKRWGVNSVAALAREVHRRRTAPNGVLSVKLFWQDVEEIVCEMAPDEFAGLPGTSADKSDPAVYRNIWSRLEAIFPNPIFVHLVRHDRLRLAVSSLAATQSGVWRDIPGASEQVASGDPAYDFDRITALISLADYCNEHWRAFFRAISARAYTIAYEDLDFDYERTVAALLKYLGRNVPVPPKRMLRQSDALTEGLARRYLGELQTRQALS